MATDEEMKSLNPMQRDVIEGLEVLGYRVVRLHAAEEGKYDWHVTYPRCRSVQVAQEAITSTWMLHVTIDDIYSIEKYTLQQMWGVVDMHRSLKEYEETTKDT